MSKATPSKITIRAYNVGFGDCLLVTFHYARSDRHILIDFGSTKAPQAKERKPAFMMEIAEDIRRVCGGKLDAVVATHRHRDHISGFATGSGGKKGTGDIIRELKPEVVIQPWTEDPKAPVDALVPVNDPGKAVAGFRRALSQMHSVALEVARYAGSSSIKPQMRKQLEFLGETNIANLSAVKNLSTMGKQRNYVYFGSKPGLDKILPGVKTYVLGPPTLKQTDTILNQVSSNKDEFWHLYRGFTSFWAFQSNTVSRLGPGTLFPRAGRRKPGPEHRWLADRLAAMQSDSVLSIVRQLDEAMNNTSVILLFETGGKRLLFPGDAQLENWMYALHTLREKGGISLLEEVDLYKVGHHGSLNATPKSLWNAFKKKGVKKSLKTVLSTRPGVHGSTARRTEVPRRALVTELELKSGLLRTDDIKASDHILCRVIEIPLG
jgi:hypothetical protein